MSECFEIRGADNATIPIEPGEYYFNTKARCRRKMLNSLSPQARRVDACLELGTMGFQQELAVVMDKGKKRPMTPTDISRQTDLSKQHVRRAISELEGAGLAERRSDDGGPLRNGHLLLYSFAIPREAKPEKGSQRAATFPTWFPPSWEPLRPLIKRLKLVLPTDEVAALGYLDEVAEAARGYQEAEKVAMEALKRVCARPPSYKEERTERTIEITSSSVPSAVATQAPARPSPIQEALAPHGTVDDDVLNQLWKACLTNASDCTPDEVAHFIREKGRLIDPRKIQNPIGFLLAAVPKCFAGDSFRQFRQQQQRERELAAQRAAEERERVERWRKEQQALLENPAVPDDEKRMLRRTLGIPDEPIVGPEL